MSMDTSGTESEIYDISCHESVVVIVSLGVCVISVVFTFHRTKGYIYSHF